MLNNSCKFILFFMSILSLSANASPRYIPEQLEQFKQTGVCVGCDLSAATLYDHPHANLSQALLVRARLGDDFSTSNFNSALMMYSDFSYINASGSTFNSANLTGAQLYGANFSSCDFTGAILTGANLDNAILVRAVISQDQLASAKSLKCAIMPDGTRYDEKNC